MGQWAFFLALVTSPQVLDSGSYLERVRGKPGEGSGWRRITAGLEDRLHGLSQVGVEAGALLKPSLWARSQADLWPSSLPPS